MIRVLIADDHPLFREGLAHALNQHDDIEIVGQAVNGLEVLDLLKVVEVDVLLLDLRMPKMDGFQVLHHLVHGESSCRVIVLSVEDPRIAMPASLKLGARAFLEKGCDVGDLIAAIHSAAEAPAVATSECFNCESDIPKRQCEVLRLLVEGKTNAEIAEALWISERTVKYHVTAILKHFGVRRRTEAIALWKGSLQNGADV